MSNSVDAVEVSVAKTDQYSRRDTVVVTGLDYNPETETHSELTGAVAGEMSKSGVQVNASDFSAFTEMVRNLNNSTEMVDLLKYHLQLQ